MAYSFVFGKEGLPDAVFDQGGHAGTIAERLAFHDFDFGVIRPPLPDYAG
jgi:hypothetical protein